MSRQSTGRTMPHSGVGKIGGPAPGPEQRRLYSGTDSICEPGRPYLELAKSGQAVQLDKSAERSVVRVILGCALVLGQNCHIQKWLRKSEQGDKWNRCLIEGMIVLSETGGRDEQTTPP